MAGKYDIGVAFDGDADRCLMVDELGHEIEINIPEASIHLAVSDEELARRKAAYVQPEPNIKTGWLVRYARMVTYANLGAVVQ